MELYETSCCGVKNYIEKLYFDPQDNEYYSPRPNREFSNGKNIKLISACPICGNKDKVFEHFDEEKLILLQRKMSSNFLKIRILKIAELI